MSTADKVAIFRQMVRIRRFEQQLVRDYCGGLIGGWLIMSIGQESIAASVRSVMKSEDHGISGCRGIAHALAAGISMKSMAAELMGKLDGCSKGKAGMFSFYSPSHHHWGCHATAAGQVPLAAGMAFALKQRDVEGASVCFLGDGAVNQGVYHETLNIAGLFGLPVVFIIENNGYAMGTSVRKSSAFRDCLAKRAEGYAMEWDRFPDSDVYEIRTKVDRALRRARIERKPSVLEIETYRYYGFTASDASSKKYRTPEEILGWKKNRDALSLWRDRLTQEGILDGALVKEIDEGAKEEAFAAANFGQESAAPAVEDITKDVYAEMDERGSKELPGRYFF